MALAMLTGGRGGAVPRKGGSCRGRAGKPGTHCGLLTAQSTTVGSPPRWEQGQALLLRVQFAPRAGSIHRLLCVAAALPGRAAPAARDAGVSLVGAAPLSHAVHPCLRALVLPAVTTGLIAEECRQGSQVLLHMRRRTCLSRQCHACSFRHPACGDPGGLRPPSRTAWKRRVPEVFGGGFGCQDFRGCCVPHCGPLLHAASFQTPKQNPKPDRSQSI